MNKLGFVRHGVTQWNKEGRAQGRTDIPLDEEGLNQARLLAERMERGVWDIVYASDLKRAAQTAEIINGKLETELCLDSRLREVDCGLIEGTTEQERIREWGPRWRELDMQFESHASIISRGMNFIDELSKNHSNKNILIVSHGSFIKHLLQELSPEAGLNDSLLNTSLTSLLKCESGWECELYNWTDHLLSDGSLKT
ncbi:probable phosphoglycerate mutase [Lentibacillus persicus]|uniref:Probable phosphoglycerate mutase n=1 Tax=Lentibacillus persicus TaxID=640948 RepID=A0A1I1YBY9_9BACI|nr:histidine phosphatase family protein [Lentibacillus persicus]SFE17107.1 probable phosphoglycerate mutase [Lentibacillus persicus]